VLGTAAALGAGACAFSLVGCSGGSSSTSGSPGTATTARPDQPDTLNPGGTPKRGGRYRYAVGADFGTWDPHLGIAVAAVYFPRIYNVLVNQSSARPEFFYFDLATAYENPDEQTFIFHIRPGVKMTPNDLGVPERALEPQDVKVALQRIASEKAAVNYTFAHDYISRIDTGPDTVTIATTRPYAWFINRIGLFTNTIPPRELLEGDVSRLQSAAAGGGPYRLTQVRQGMSASFERNPNYYRKDASGAQLPYVDGLDVPIITDHSAQHTAFLSGQLEQYLPNDGREARTLTDGFTVGRNPNFSFISFAMNPRQPPFNDARVRRAFSRAINRQEYIDIIFGGEAKPDGLVHWSLGAYALDAHDLAATYQPYSVADAKQLVSQVGGIKVKMSYPASFDLERHSDHLPIFLGQMKAAGIEIDPDPQPFATFLDNFQKLDYICALNPNQIYEIPEIPLGFHTTKGPLGDGSYVRGMGDPEIEAAVKKANETTDNQARIAAVHDAQKVIYARDPMFLPLVTPYEYNAYSKRVHDAPSGIGTSAWLINTFWLDT
jgi:ABC-type transport system substrate-binding protein